MLRKEASDPFRQPEKSALSPQENRRQNAPEEVVQQIDFRRLLDLLSNASSFLFGTPNPSPEVVSCLTTLNEIPFYAFVNYKARLFILVSVNFSL
jgi:hypothetical protein